MVGHGDETAGGREVFGSLDVLLQGPPLAPGWPDPVASTATGHYLPMGLVTFSRPKRIAQPAMPRGDVLLEPPPEIPAPPTGRNFGAVLRMLPMVAGALAMGMMMMGGTMMGGRGPTTDRKSVV